MCAACVLHVHVCTLHQMCRRACGHAVLPALQCTCNAHAMHMQCSVLEAATLIRQVLAVKRLLDMGLIKHWGLSNENAYGITMFCVTADKLGVPRPVSCQVISRA